MKTDQNLEGQSKLQDPGIFHAVIQFWHHSSVLSAFYFPDSLYLICKAIVTLTHVELNN
jgi:hypothetical protein